MEHSYLYTFRPLVTAPRLCQLSVICQLESVGWDFRVNSNWTLKPNRSSEFIIPWLYSHLEHTPWLLYFEKCKVLEFLIWPEKLILTCSDEVSGMLELYRI